MIHVCERLDTISTSSLPPLKLETVPILLPIFGFFGSKPSKNLLQPRRHCYILAAIRIFSFRYDFNISTLPNPPLYVEASTHANQHLVQVFSAQQIRFLKPIETTSPQNIHRHRFERQHSHFELASKLSTSLLR